MNGKQKGAAFERSVCRGLSLWVSKGTQEDVFWRSAMSGGRSTVAFARGKRLAAQAGDISCIHPIGAAFATKFFVECKHYRNLDFPGAIKSKGSLYKFWVEAKEQAEKYNKEPMLICQQNRYPALVGLTSFGRTVIGTGPSEIVIAYPQHDLYFVTFEDFQRYAVPLK